MKMTFTLVAALGVALSACSGGASEENNAAEMDANMMVTDMNVGMDGNMIDMNADSSDMNAGMASDMNGMDMNHSTGTGGTDGSGTGSTTTP